MGKKIFFFFSVVAVLWNTVRDSKKPKISPFNSDLSIQSWSRYCTSLQRDLEYRQKSAAPSRYLSMVFRSAVMPRSSSMTSEALRGLAGLYTSLDNINL